MAVPSGPENIYAPNSTDFSMGIIIYITLNCYTYSLIRHLHAKEKSCQLLHNCCSCEVSAIVTYWRWKFEHIDTLLPWSVVGHLRNLMFNDDILRR